MKFLKIKTAALTIVSCCISLILFAQTPAEHTIAGFVCTKGTTVRVPVVQVMNRRTGAMIFTDDVGTFKIKAAIGDTLQFTKDQYTTQYQRVVGLPDMVVFLTKVIALDNVMVKGQTTKQEMTGMMDEYRRKGIYNGGKNTLGGSIASPLNALNNVFSRDAKNARHFAEFAKNEEAAAQDSKKYNKYIVKQVTGLSDTECEVFMDDFRPSHEELLTWSNYDVIAYIKRSLPYFEKNGGKGLPKLNDKTPMKVDSAKKPATTVKPAGN